MLARESKADPALLMLVREGIIEQRFIVDGKVLPERFLAEALGVTRAKLRHALDVLETEGIVFRRHGQGTFAAPPPAVNAPRLKLLAKQVTPQDIMEVRLEVEPALAALAANRASSDEVILLEQLMLATQRASDTESYDAADQIFHYKIAELARNSLFLTVYESIQSVRRHAEWTLTRKQAYSPATIRTLADQHRELYDHIANRNAAGAAGAMERHLIQVSNAILRVRGHDTAADPGLPAT